MLQITKKFTNAWLLNNYIFHIVKQVSILLLWSLITHCWSSLDFRTKDPTDMMAACRVWEVSPSTPNFSYHRDIPFNSARWYRMAWLTLFKMRQAWFDLINCTLFKKGEIWRIRILVILILFINYLSIVRSIHFFSFVQNTNDWWGKLDKYIRFLQNHKL